MGAKSRFVQPTHRSRQQFQKFKMADEDPGRRCRFGLHLFDWIAVLQAEASAQARQLTGVISLIRFGFRQLLGRSGYPPDPPRAILIWIFQRLATRSPTLSPVLSTCRQRALWSW